MIKIIVELFKLVNWYKVILIVLVAITFIGGYQGDSIWLRIVNGSLQAFGIWGISQLGLWSYHRDEELFK